MVQDVRTLLKQERGALAGFLETLTADVVDPVAVQRADGAGGRFAREFRAHGSNGDDPEGPGQGWVPGQPHQRPPVPQWAARRGPEAIVAGLRDPDSINNPTPGMRLADVLADTIAHHLDVRAPLDQERSAPVEATAIALTVYTRQGFPLSLALGRNPKATAKGLRLVAEDIGWSHGAGPEVTASSSALVRAFAGRPVRRSELSGGGADLLFGRLDTP